MTTQEHVKRVREALEYYWESSVMLHRSDSIKANADDSLRVIERALTPPDDLRKLAEETAQSIGDIVNSNPRPRQKMEKKIITALQSVQRAERDKAEGLRSALEAIERHQRLCMEGTASLSTTWNIANKALATYEASKEKPDA